MIKQTSARLRSWLFTPATEPQRFAKATEIGADAIILDLEDAVALQDKDKARATALEYLSTSAPDGPARVLRINGLDTAAGLADLVALLQSPAQPEMVLLPKTNSAAHLQILDALFTKAKKDIRLVGLIESARGLCEVERIAVATPRLLALAFGAADLAADLGAQTAWEPLLAARNRLIAACALGGVLPIDTPYFDVHDLDTLRQDIARAVALGFTGKMAIHPTQVAPINEALTPSEDDIKKASEILQVNEKGIGMIDGQMIDEAVARKARRTLAAAGAGRP